MQLADTTDPPNAAITTNVSDATEVDDAWKQLVHPMKKMQLIQTNI